MPFRNRSIIPRDRPAEVFTHICLLIGLLRKAVRQHAFAKSKQKFSKNYPMATKRQQKLSYLCKAQTRAARLETGFLYAGDTAKETSYMALLSGAGTGVTPFKCFSKSPRPRWKGFFMLQNTPNP